MLGLDRGKGLVRQIVWYSSVALPLKPSRKEYPPPGANVFLHQWGVDAYARIQHATCQLSLAFLGSLLASPGNKCRVSLFLGTPFGRLKGKSAFSGFDGKSGFVLFREGRPLLYFRLGGCFQERWLQDFRVQTAIQTKGGYYNHHFIP